MSRVLKLFALTGLILMPLTGCVSRIGDFSIVSTGAPQYDSMDSAPMQKTVRGKDSRLWFLFIPFGGAPNIKEAVDQCLDLGKGDFMERARFTSTGWTIILFSYGSITCTGDVGNSKIDQTIR